MRSCVLWHNLLFPLSTVSPSPSCPLAALTVCTTLTPAPFTHASGDARAEHLLSVSAKISITFAETLFVAKKREGGRQTDEEEAEEEEAKEEVAEEEAAAVGIGVPKT